MQIVVAALFALLAVAFWMFQVAQHQKFDEMAENNHRRRLPLPAPRGVLFDRDGKVLVENQNTVNIALDPRAVRKHRRNPRVLAAATGADEAQLRETVNRRRREPSYRPIVLIENATQAQIAAWMARRLELPGIIEQEVPARQYPQNELAAHLFGYVGEASETELTRPEYAGAESGSMVGKAGVEPPYNKLLMGATATSSSSSTAAAARWARRRRQEPVEGRRVQLTIDADVQRATEEGFHHFGLQRRRRHPRSALGRSPVVHQPARRTTRTQFAGGIDLDRLELAHQQRPLKPLQNRALQGTYSPGSTFKIAVATAALEEGVVTPDFRVFCPGGATFYGRYFQCHLKGGHGSVDMRHAIEKSCNVYFYTLGNMLGVDQDPQVGVAARPGRAQRHRSAERDQGPRAVDRVEERRRASEVVPGRDDFGLDRPGPGQRDAAVAGGHDDDDRQRRHALHAARAQGGRRRARAGSRCRRRRRSRRCKMKQSTIDALHEGLWMVVNAAGTGGRARIPGFNVAGKTGTAQVISLTGAKVAKGKMDVRDHGWFVFFAPHDKPEIAGVIFAEHAEHGYSAPDRQVRDGNLFREEGRPAAADAAAEGRPARRRSLPPASRRRPAAAATAGTVAQR